MFIGFEAAHLYVYTLYFHTMSASAPTSLTPAGPLALLTPLTPLTPAAPLAPRDARTARMAAQLFLKPDVVAAIAAGDESIYPVSGDAPPVPDGGSRPEREALWVAAFPHAAAAVVVAATRLFPATSLETFKVRLV